MDTNGPKSLRNSISPPPTARTKSSRVDDQDDGVQAEETAASVHSNGRPSLAAIEAGQAKILDHLIYFSDHFRQTSRSTEESAPRLTIDGYRDLYLRNQGPRGHHFVVHQHNHPVSGVHYDLRLQFSETSTMSFAIPYGLPGNPNSKRQGRMAIETRVHTLWNNLIEAASHATGSLLIWDTGEYEVLPRRLQQAKQTDDELSGVTDDELSVVSLTNEPAKLVAAFQSRHIRLRLHGTRLPHNYTVSLRLPSQNNRSKQLPKPSPKRRRKNYQERVAETMSTDSESDTGTGRSLRRNGSISTGRPPAANDGSSVADASEDEAVDEGQQIRLDNAYTGATNDIGSVHQRNWFLLLDRQSSGFVKATRRSEIGRWIRSSRSAGKDEESRSLAGFEPFYVQGPDIERSVVTGRLSGEIMADEGVENFQPRKMWRPILE